MKVSQKELADIFGVSTRTIRSWQANGMPAEGQRKDRRRCDTEDCISWYVANRADGASADGNGDLPPVEESDRRWRRQRTRLKELDLEEKRRNLVLMSGAVETFEDVAARIRQRLLDLPGRRLKQVAAETDPGGAGGPERGGPQDTVVATGPVPCR